MKNTTKLKTILLLYSITLDMEEDGNLHLTLINKRTNNAKKIIDKSYTEAIQKAYSHMRKELKNPHLEN